MRDILFDFQESAVSDLHSKIKSAHLLMQDGNDPQVISFSSPTGSGKTVIMTTLIEEILYGNEEKEGQANAVFIWLSDMPQLNEQTRLKIESKSDKIRVRNVVTIESSFDSEVFERGNIYFLNTQKLGDDKLLANKSDERKYTIWETISNIAKMRPKELYCIIDEAHRGMNISTRDINQAQSVMQKFLLGSDIDGLVQMPLVIGVTATPQRFEKMLEGTASTIQKVIVKPEEVRKSGLLKDKIIIHYPEILIYAEMTMLKSAIENWKIKKKHWKEYCRREETVVNPIMVIQVEDGNENTVTKTNISECISILEESLGRKLISKEIVHTFDSKLVIKENGLDIQYVEPSRIEENQNINFVLFKMNLSTGWDCPRAEVMMSFRSAQDYTYIAQLLGRMIRTPLARRIQYDMELNNVRLFLPHYDEKTVRTIISSLEKSDDVISSNTTTSDKIVYLYTNDHYKEVFNKTKDLITYKIETNKKINAIRRSMKLSRALTQDAIDINAQSYIQNEIVKIMNEEIDKIKKTGEFDRISKNIIGFDLSEITFDVGENLISINECKEKVIVNEFDIEFYFKRAGKIIGEALEMIYWIKNEERDKNEVKLEIIGLANNEHAMKVLDSNCEKLFNSLYEANKYKIAKLSEVRRSVYERIISKSQVPVNIYWNLPEVIEFPKSNEDKAYKNHLYVDENGCFKTKLTSWEDGVIKEELQHNDIAWFRNLDRKEWSLQIPYEKNGFFVPMYPDIIVIRKIDDDYIVDILEPHDSSRKDNCAKAKGLANFADKHWNLFGRIELIRKYKGEDKQEHFYRLDMSKIEIRNIVKTINSNSELDGVFKKYASVKKDIL
ncbi:MAG: DEAD/DEAH box helicase [Sarcina sp.]